MSYFLPISLASEDKGKDDSVKKDKPYKIFFKDLFLYKENEMAAKKKEKFINRSMKVYQKSTFSSRMKSRSHLGQVAFYSDTAGGSFEKFGLDPTFILRLTEGVDTKRTIHEFINDQRDRFLLEYALSTKRNTIKKFEKHMVAKERQLTRAEKKLQEDAMAFEEFLRENDQRSVDALKIAAQETINKLQMTAELKKASMEVQAVKSEIAKTEFLLREYMKYGFFLLKLSPKHWQIQQALKRAQMTKNKESMNVSLPVLTKLHTTKTEGSNEDARKISFSDDYYVERRRQGKPHKKPTLTVENKKSSLSSHAESISSEDSLEFFLDNDTNYDLEPELYFKEPEELLQVLTELEEQNLTLVQYSQDVDENLEDVNKREKLIQDKINSNIEFLLEHKEMLKASCVREEEKAAELELRSRLFSFGEFKSDTQEKLIDSLSKKINQVYKVCIGDADVGSLNPVQKLVKVESRLVELSDLIESIPKENVEAIERIKQKERRQKLREEKMKEKQKHQEERLRAALERAVAQPKKKLGRRLVYRSKPPSGNKHELLLVKDTRTKSLEDEYFFT
ncbi:coiled-coil domain-containing protein 38 isoform X6 [Callorhinus ursinus]|uniref:Coiled-coil domain-containing protein 38-like isoform X1 n=1 Tax=Callorhinus ursinus TaxID=34884 RepID=A0A3Q7PTP0_CALUR|nr:coiled-coil domain-containing protein 38-like isoform X1 [Callorhinus ursinus]XP_025738356.1 coiled-coil domain-containing protein 38-like isoform X2 [Callorhinus ursinus]